MGADMMLAFAKGGARDTELITKPYTWAQLIERLSKVSVGDKDGSYLIRGGKLKEPSRADENLLEAELLIIDGDSSVDPETGEITKGAPDIDIARRALDNLGYRYIIHTTHSHIPGVVNKWRAFLPAHMVSQKELQCAAEYVVDQLHAKGCYVDLVREVSVWAQAWYLPRCKPEYRDAFRCFASLRGRDVDVKGAVAVAAAAKAAADVVSKAQQELPPREKSFTGESPIEAFNRQAGFATVRVLLENAGYKFAGKRGDVLRFIAPASETGTPGVTVFKGSQRGDIVAYSHHGAHDPLSGRLTDAFGLLTRLRHGGDEEAALAEAKEKIGWKPGYDALSDFSDLKVDAEDFRDAPKPKAGPKGPLFIPAKAFAEGWKAAEYLVDGLIQRGYCYSLTSPTGHGKTAVILTLAACLGTGRSFGNAETMPGRVGYFAAENPNDVQARWIGLQEHMGFDDANVFFCPETVDLKTTFDRVTAEAEAAGGFDLIVVDTSQAFFSGADENSNAEMVAHAKAMRKLSTLPGNPCVIILTHPVKNPSKDNLLPRGGGGFLAEVDGNLTIWNDGGNLELHHQGKFRGAGFAPLNFVLKPVTPARLVDAKGRQIPTVVAEYVTEAQYSVLLEDFAKDQDKVMLMILESEGKATVAEMCRRAGWVGKGGVENKAKVHRIIGTLKAAKLVGARRGGKPYLTAAGEEEIKAKAQALGIRTKGRKKPVQDDDDSTF